MPESSKKAAARFYLEENLSGPSVTLPREEADHAYRARRLRAGALVELFDGKGGLRRGVLEGNRSDARVRFVEPLATHPMPSNQLVVAVSPPKGDRMRFLVEKLSELDVDRMVPTLFRRSLDTGQKAESSRESRWQRFTVESAKQCGRLYLLEVETVQPLETLIERWNDFDLKLLLHQSPDAEPLARIAQEARAGLKNVLLIVGPEGGLTDDEADRIRALGAVHASLGSEILRVETAALAAAALWRLTERARTEEKP